MKATLDKIKKLSGMKIINLADYDINKRIDLILADIQRQLKQYEQDALEQLDGKKI